MSQNKATIYQFLNQHRPATTDPELLYSPGVGEQVIARQLIISNNDNQDREYSIYYHHDGNETTSDRVIAPAAIIEAGQYIIIPLELPLRNSAGTIHVQTDKANELNFTLTGDK